MPKNYHKNANLPKEKTASGARLLLFVTHIHIEHSVGYWAMTGSHLVMVGGLENQDPPASPSHTGIQGKPHDPGSGFILEVGRVFIKVTHGVR